MSIRSRRDDSELKYLYIRDPDKYSKPTKKADTNKTVRNNFIKVFVFLFVIMMFFMIYSRIANGVFDVGLNAYPLSPDTDTKVRLEWSSVPGARTYRLFRNDGTGAVEIAFIDVNSTLDPHSFDDTNLKPDTQYIYTIRSYTDAAGTQLLEAGTDEAFAMTSPMIRPYGLKAVYDINSRKAYLTWNHSAIAGGSIICRYEGDQLVYEREVPETSSAEEKVYEPGPVSFTVKTKAALPQYGVSEASYKVTVVPISAPSIKAAYVNQSTVSINWDDSRYISIFELEESRWDDASSSWGSWTTVSSTLSGGGISSTVTVGGKYRYRLIAKSGSGYSGVSQITEYISNLAAPTDLTAVIVSDKRVDLSWTNAAGNDGSLQVWRKVGGDKDGGGYTLLATLSNNTSTYSDQFSLVSGTTYHYRVNAVNAQGNYSAFAYAGITVAIPAAPTALRTSITSSDGITITWTDNSNNESGFKIERFDETSKVYSQIATVAADTTTFMDTSVVAGESYIYRVRAYNIMGNSSYSNEVVVNAWDTSAPTFLRVEPVSSTRLDLSWNFSGTVKYNTIIERKTGVEGKWETIYTTAAGVVKYSDTGLTPNTRYFYRVRKSLGSNSAGIPYPNNEIGIGAITYLGDITLTGTAYENNRIYLTWTGNSSGADIIIERKMANGSFSAIMTVSPQTQGWYDDTGLVPGASYSYRVKAKTQTNQSLYSNEVTVGNYHLPAPANLSITANNDLTIDLEWVDKSTEEAGFEIWRKVEDSNNFVLYATVGRNITAFKDTSVERDIQYSYRVRAFTESGGVVSAYSNTAVIKVGMMRPPADLRYTYISEKQVSLQWTDTSDNETGFIIERRIGESGEWETVTWLTSDTKSFTVSGLNKYTKYYFRVKAFNSINNIEAVSDEILVTTALPTAPSDITATAIAASQVKLTWRDNSDNEDKYIIMRSRVSERLFSPVAEVGKDVTSFVDNSVRGGIEYYYKIAAANTVGNAESREVNVRTPAGTRFTDTGGVPWAEEAIESMAGMGILKGVTDTQFKPGNVISRAEFTAMVVRAFKLETAPVGSLADVKSNKWYYREVMIAENLGVISGDADNKFYPESPITREDISMMLFKAIVVSGRRYSLHENSVLEKFIDRDQISPHAVASMAALVGEGIIEGLQGNAIGPKYAATRAQAAVFVYRALTKSEPIDKQ